jgi:hypothetical protein
MLFSRIKVGEKSGVNLESKKAVYFYLEAAAKGRGFCLQMEIEIARHDPQRGIWRGERFGGVLLPQRGIWRGATAG